MVERSRGRNFKVCIFMDYGRYCFKRFVVCFSMNNMNIYMIFKLTKLDNEATGWLYLIMYESKYMCLYIHDYVMVFLFMVILRSTTGPYGRPIVEVAYGEILCSLHRGCMGVDSSGRMVGVST